MTLPSAWEVSMGIICGGGFFMFIGGILLGDFFAKQKEFYRSYELKEMKVFSIVSISPAFKEKNEGLMIINLNK